MQPEPQKSENQDITQRSFKCILLISTVANKFPDRDAGDSQFSAVQPDAATEIQ
jgi:hypothetical protein